MGSLTSKYLEEMTQTPQRSTHVLESDPRSPSDNITRTPISVTDTPDRGSNGTPATKVLPFDPRSPTTELDRTPIVVETKDTRRRPFALKPSRLIDPNTVAAIEDLDPRSPTSRVPRTPLSDQTHSFTNKEAVEERVSGKDVQEGEQEKAEEEKDDQDSCVSSSSSNEENKGLDETPQKELLSLTGSNKRSMNTSRNPQSILQARQCQAIEAEYTKNQQVLITQLAEETKTPTLPSNTQFVENI